MDIVALISSIASEVTGTPLFLHGEESFLNLKGDDVDVSKGIICLYEPIQSNDSPKQSGYLEETYPLKIFFAKKTELDWTSAEHQVIIQQCRELRREFIVLLQGTREIRYVRAVRTIDVTNVYDVNVSGVFVQIDITPLYLAANCFPEPELPIAAFSYSVDELEISVNGSASTGDIELYKWFIDDVLVLETTGPTATLPEVESSGSYKVCLIVVSETGDTSQVCKTVVVDFEPVNLPPVVDAGDNIYVQLPTNQVQLEALAIDPEGGPVTYKLTVLQSPGGAVSFDDDTDPETFFHFTQQGRYAIKVKATDDHGNSAFDVLSLNVRAEADTNVPPFADAGDNEIVTQPDAIDLDSSASYDPDGTIVSTLWSVLSGPGAGSFVDETAVITQFINPGIGDYVFQVLKTDNDGAISAATVVKTVEAAASESKITLTTSDVDLELGLHAAVMSDIGFISGFQPRDVMAINYKGKVEDLNLTGGGQFPVGVEDNWYHPAPDKDEIVSGGSGNGYNPNPADFVGTPEDQEDVAGGVMSASLNFGKDFLYEFNAFCRALAAGSGIPRQIIANIQNYVWLELKHIIDVVQPNIIALGNEIMATSNQYWCANGAAYVGIVQPINNAIKAYDSSIKTALNVAPISNVNWNTACQAATGYDYIAFYVHIGKMQNNTGDPVTDLQAFKQSLITTLPAQLDGYSALFPGKKKAIFQIGEYHNNVDGYPLQYQQTIFSLILSAKMYPFYLRRQLEENDIVYSSIMSLKYLVITGSMVAKEYYAYLQMGQLFVDGAKVCDISFAPEIQGLDIAAVKIGSDFRIVLINETEDQKDIPDLNMDGEVESNFQYTCYYGTSYLSTNIIKEVGTFEDGLVIRPMAIYYLTKVDED